jgi:hypothetical protein
MRNLYFTEKSLQFSKLRTSPWEVSFLFLLCFLLTGAFLFPHRRRLFSGPSLSPSCSSLSLSSTGRAGRKRAGAGRWRSARATARRAGERRCERAREAAGELARALAGELGSGRQCEERRRSARGAARLGCSAARGLARRLASGGSSAQAEPQRRALARCSATQAERAARARPERGCSGMALRGRPSVDPRGTVLGQGRLAARRLRRKRSGVARRGRARGTDRPRCASGSWAAQLQAAARARRSAGAGRLASRGALAAVRCGRHAAQAWREQARVPSKLLTRPRGWSSRAQVRSRRRGATQHRRARAAQATALERAAQAALEYAVVRRGV